MQLPSRMMMAKCNGAARRMHKHATSKAKTQTTTRLTPRTPTRKTYNNTTNNNNTHTSNNITRSSWQNTHTHLTRRSYAANATPPPPPHTPHTPKPQNLLQLGQVDAGFYQGAALLGAVAAAVVASSPDQREHAVDQLLNTYRYLGLSSNISDEKLIHDYVQKNAAAAVNVVYASPTFYFLFSKMHGQSLLISSIRALTGTMRIVPFMGFFYASFALISPFVADALMERGQTYEEASGNAAMAVMLSGFVFVEAVVELRGCGVTFGQMNGGAFLLFIPALIGRLATGVLTQQQKVGVESEPLYPESWRDGPTWQQHSAMTADMLHIDKDFVVTACGTSVFQHVLNGVTWTLLTKGRGASVGEMLRFIFGGMNGNALSGAAQFGKTLFLRSCFGFVWNWCSSQQVDMPAFGAALDTRAKAGSMSCQ